MVTKCANVGRFAPYWRTFVNKKWAVTDACGFEKVTMKFAFLKEVWEWVFKTRHGDTAFSCINIVEESQFCSCALQPQGIEFQQFTLFHAI